jgi:D-lactate dehydrogenase
MKIIIYSAHGFEKDHILRANNNRHELKFISPYLGIETAALSKGFDTASLFVNDDGSAPVLEILKSNGIKYIALRTAGYNHVDLVAAKKLGLKVANVPEYSPYSVAEHTLALILVLNRKLIRAHNRVMDLNFSLDGLTGFDLHGKTVGIIGVGKIGATVAKILHGFGCRLLGYDLSVNTQLQENLALAYVDLDTLCSNSDIITLHAPLNTHTHYIINKKQIEKMKDGVMLINTSRGGLVNTKEVVRALKSGKIGYLGMDVYEEEKGLFFEDHSENILQDDVIARLMTFRNVLITCHQAFLTNEALDGIAGTTIKNINEWEQNGIAGNEIKII